MVCSTQVCENIVGLLQDNKRSIDRLLSRLVTTSGTITDSCKKYFKVLKVNANLHYENTQLKIELSQKKMHDFLNEGCESQLVCNRTVFSSRNKLLLNKKPTTNNLKKKMLVVGHRPPYSRIRRRTIKANFKSVHEMFSPYFRRRIIRYNSDPCLTRI